MTANGPGDDGRVANSLDFLRNLQSPSSSEMNEDNDSAESNISPASSNSSDINSSSGLQDNEEDEQGDIDMNENGVEPTIANLTSLQQAFSF